MLFITIFVIDKVWNNFFYLIFFILNSRLATLLTTLYFNLIRLNLALNNKKQAEAYLNEMQENLIGIKLSYDEQNELKALESEIYKK